MFPSCICPTTFLRFVQEMVGSRHHQPHNSLNLCKFDLLNVNITPLVKDGRNYCRSITVSESTNGPLAIDDILRPGDTHTHICLFVSITRKHSFFRAK